MASLCNSLVSSHIPSPPPPPYLSPVDFLLILEYMLLHLTSGSVYAVPWDPPLLIPTHPSPQLKKKYLFKELPLNLILNFIGMLYVLTATSTFLREHLL